MESFEDLFRGHYETVYQFLMKLSGYDGALAEELTQETFYRAYLALPDFRGQCQLRTWLIQIAKNCFYQVLRKRRDTLPLHEVKTDPVSSAPPLPEQLEEAEALEQARRIIDAMQSPMRDVILYRIYSNLTYVQIAAMLSISESSAKVLFYRGKQLLRTQLKEVYGYEI